MLNELSGMSIIDMHEEVVCDFCYGVYTESEVSGGGLVGDCAVCPECIEQVYRDGYTPDPVCPEGMAFKEFILRLRGGNNFIAIQKVDDK